jgi:hypothetical protein|nr:MAG TPA: HepA-related protein (HARP) [Caudoviricetes sp.]
MEMRKENGNIYLKFGYNLDFSGKLKRYCGAKWQASTKEWYFADEFEDKMNDLMLKQFGYSMRKSPRITIEFSANDFYSKDSLDIRIEGYCFVYREYEHMGVEMLRNSIILEGGFKERDGSKKYPKAEPLEGTVIRAKITEELYNTFSDETKSKIKVVKEADKKEALLARKAALLKELAEIEKELSEQ